MPGIPVRRRLLIIQDPVIRDDPRIVVAHNALAQVINAVLVVALVHFRHGGLGRRLLWEVDLLLRKGGGGGGEVVVLPEIVQAVKVVGAARNGDVAACSRWDRGWKDD